MTRALVPTEDVDHAGKAALADWTASLNSVSVQRGTLEMTSCVACEQALLIRHGRTHEQKAFIFGHIAQWYSSESIES